MNKSLRGSFLELVRLGIGTSKDAKISKELDWAQLKVLADRQGLTAVVLDALDAVHHSIPLDLKLKWIGEVLQGEETYKLHQKVATDMADLFQQNGIRTYVLKGRIIAECYPRPEHRVSSDMDCFLMEEVQADKAHLKAWKKGNELIKAKGFEVGEGFYKNSSFHMPGLMVENHQFLTPFRGNKRLKLLETMLQAMLNEDKGEDVIEGTWLYRPPVMVSALFLIEHAYSHFLHEGLTWRMVLDWVMFEKKHETEIDWNSFDVLVDEFGFRKFYDSFARLAQYLIGEPGVESLELRDRRMLDDIWAPLDLHESLQGVKAKFQLAGNFWRARWKYTYFTDMTWVRALTEWVTGAVFDRHPTLV